MRLLGKWRLSCGAARADGWGRIAEPAAPAPGDAAELRRVRHQLAGRWHVHAIPPGYVAVYGTGQRPVHGVMPGDLAYGVRAAETAR